MNNPNPKIKNPKSMDLNRCIKDNAINYNLSPKPSWPPYRYPNMNSQGIVQAVNHNLEENLQFKHKQTLEEKREELLRWYDYKYCLSKVKINGMMLQDCKCEQTEELCLEAIKDNVRALYHVKDQTDTICKWAVQNHLIALRFIRNQTEELCFMALEKYIYAIEHIREPTEEMYKMILAKDTDFIHYMDIVKYPDLWTQYCLRQI